MSTQNVYRLPQRISINDLTKKSPGRRNTDKQQKVQEKFQPDYTTNYREYPKGGSRARELIGQQGVDHILEIGGIGTIEQSIEALAFGGHISVIGYLAKVGPSKMPNVL
ncbi:hypothetical protein BDV10DRAFT_184371 [Aspergillus recurvatus]